MSPERRQPASLSKRLRRDRSELDPVVREWFARHYKTALNPTITNGLRQLAHGIPAGDPHERALILASQFHLDPRVIEWLLTHDQVILDTDFVNFRANQFQQSDPINWGRNVCSGNTYLMGYNPAWEWTPILDPNDEYDEYLVGTSGIVLKAHRSEHDLPFTHPFGNDWNFDLAVDWGYEQLLAPNNVVVDSQGHPNPKANGDAVAAVQQARDDLGISVSGTLHVEMDEHMLPEAYRPRDFDRVAVFGRWIIDCGHDDFSSEIHPPLLLARAEEVSGDETHSTVIGRPFLVSQEFGDGALYDHLLKQIARIVPLSILFGPFELADRVEARPRVLDKPFSGLHLMKYTVKPAKARVSPNDKLMVSFNFVVRPGIVVQLTKATDSDGVTVWVLMNDLLHNPAPLPSKHDRDVSIDYLKTEAPDQAQALDELLSGVGINNAIAAQVVAKGVLTDAYDPAVASSPFDSQVTTLAVDELHGPYYSEFELQPFPIYGFLDVKWERRS